MSTPPTTTKKYLITSRQPNCNIDVKSTYDERKKSGYDIKSKYNNIVDPICQRDANKYTPVNKKNTAVTQNYYDILGRKKAFRNRKVIPHKSSMQTSSMIEKEECVSPQKNIFKFVNKPNHLQDKFKLSYNEEELKSSHMKPKHDGNYNSNSVYDCLTNNNKYIDLNKQQMYMNNNINNDNNNNERIKVNVNVSRKKYICPNNTNDILMMQPHDDEQRKMQRRYNSESSFQKIFDNKGSNLNKGKEHSYRRSSDVSGGAPRRRVQYEWSNDNVEGIFKSKANENVEEMVLTPKTTKGNFSVLSEHARKNLMERYAEDAKR